MIRIPLTQKEIDGLPCDRPMIVLKVLTRFGDWVELRFLLDTGSDLPCIQVSDAQKEGIPFDRTRSGTSAGLLGRATRYRGTIRVKIGKRIHIWPCYFIETPANVGSAAIAVLGRAGFRDDYDFCVDDKYLTLTRRTRIRRWWHPLLRFLSRPFVTHRKIDEPL